MYRGLTSLAAAGMAGIDASPGMVRADFQAMHHNGPLTTWYDYWLGVRDAPLRAPRVQGDVYTLTQCHRHWCSALAPARCHTPRR